MLLCHQQPSTLTDGLLLFCLLRTYPVAVASFLPKVVQDVWLFLLQGVGQLFIISVNHTHVAKEPQGQFFVHLTTKDGC